MPQGQTPHPRDADVPRPHSQAVAQKQKLARKVADDCLEPRSERIYDDYSKRSAPKAEENDPPTASVAPKHSTPTKPEGPARPPAHKELAVPPGALGITVRCYHGEPGAVVMDISPACAVRDEIHIGDRIVGVDGREVTNMGDMHAGKERVRVFRIMRAGADAANAQASYSGGEATIMQGEHSGQTHDAGNEILGTGDETSRKINAFLRNRLSSSPTGGPSEETVPEASGDDDDDSNAAKIDAPWLNLYNRFVDHVMARGISAPLEGKGNKKLRDWISKQRTAYRRDQLGDEKVERLREVNFDFNGGSTALKLNNDERWLKCFDRLSGYVEKYGAIPHNPADPEGKWAEKWLKTQRKRKIHGKLSEERMRCLVKLNDSIKEGTDEKGEDTFFGMNLKSKADEEEDRWENYFDKLHDLSRINGGDANVLRNSDGFNNKLYDWAKDQRTAYKDGLLSSERATRLESIGLDLSWDSRRARANLSWDEMYDKLCDYHRTFGHTYVPFHYKSEDDGKSLGHWVYQQRQAFNGTKKGRRLHMNIDRKEKLEKIGFEFRLNHQLTKHVDDKWNVRLKELIAYKRANDGKDPSTRVKGLGSWCANQRQAFRMGTLDQNRTKKLEEAGFKLIFSDMRWESKIEEYVLYKAEHGGEEPHNNNTSLGRWCSTQRLNYHKGKLKGDEISRLRAIGFDFTISLQAQTRLATNKESENMYLQLLDFYEENGHCEVGDSNQILEGWINRVQGRRLYTTWRSSVSFIDILDARGQEKCFYEGCHKYALFNGACCSHNASAARRKFNVAQPGVLLSGQIDMIREAFKAGRPVDRPKAASELDFDIEDPPSFREPSELVTLDRGTVVNDKDVVFIGTYSLKGNSSYRELLHDFQPTYITTSRMKRRLIANSLVAVVHNRGGRFFRQETTDAPFRELSDEAITDRTCYYLAKKLYARELKSEMKRLNSEKKSFLGTTSTEEDSKE